MSEKYNWVETINMNDLISWFIAGLIITIIMIFAMYDLWGKKDSSYLIVDRNHESKSIGKYKKSLFDPKTKENIIIFKKNFKKIEFRTKENHDNLFSSPIKSFFRVNYYPDVHILKTSKGNYLVNNKVNEIRNKISRKINEIRNIRNDVEGDSYNVNSNREDILKEDIEKIYDKEIKKTEEITPIKYKCIYCGEELEKKYKHCPYCYSKKIKMKV